MKPYYSDERVRNPKSEPVLRYNESSPGGWWNTRRSLTRSLDLTKEGLMPNSIRSTLAESNAAKTECPSGHPHDARVAAAAVSRVNPHQPPPR